MSLFAIFVPCLLTGGTEVASLDTAKAFMKLGYNVEVVVYFDEVDLKMYRVFSEAGVKLRLLGLSRTGGIKSSLRLTFGLIRALSGRRYSLIWAQYMTPTLLPLLVARIFTQKLVAAVHVAAGHYSSRGIKRLRWFARRWCDCFVCVSRTTAQGLFGDYANERAFAERVRVIPNSVDIDAVDGAMSRDWRTELGLEPKTMLAGYVGRLAHNKGADVLIRAAARLLSVKPDLHWVFVGDGEERASLQSMVDQAALSSRVHFAGSLSRDAVYGAMKGFDIAVVPSREEGFGLTALEAMACRVPLVASAVDALQEIVVDGETGVLFKTEDDADLAGMLFALVDDPEKMKRIGLQGGMRARELYCRAAFDRDISELVGSLFKKI